MVMDGSGWSGTCVVTNVSDTECQRDLDKTEESNLYHISHTVLKEWVWTLRDLKAKHH